MTPRYNGDHQSHPRIRGVRDLGARAFHEPHPRIRKAFRHFWKLSRTAEAPHVQKNALRARSRLTRPGVFTHYGRFENDVGPPKGSRVRARRVPVDGRRRRMRRSEPAGKGENLHRRHRSQTSGKLLLAHGILRRIQRGHT